MLCQATLGTMPDEQAGHRGDNTNRPQSCALGDESHQDAIGREAGQAETVIAGVGTLPTLGQFNAQPGQTLGCTGYGDLRSSR